MTYVQKILAEKLSKLEKSKIKLNDKIALIDDEINEIMSAIEDLKSSPKTQKPTIEESPKEEEPIQPQTVVVCIYQETADNAPVLDNFLWYPTYQNSNTTEDITELLKTNTVLIGNDSKNPKDESYLKALAAHFNIKFLGDE